MIAPVVAALRRTGRIAAERPGAALWTVIALACALFAVGASAVIADGAARRAATAEDRGGAAMVVYLGEGVDDARASALVSELRGLPGVERATLVSAAESAKRLSQALGADAALLDGVEVASLPASVEVTLSPGVRDVVAMSPTVRALRGAPGVADVVVADGAAAQSGGASALATIEYFAVLAAGLFAAIAIVVVLAALRVRLARDPREREVLDLLGAGPTFQLIPTALAGALAGAFAALLASVAVLGVLYLWGGSIAVKLGGALGPVELAVPSLALFAIFVAAGAALGLVGGGLAGASRHR